MVKWQEENMKKCIEQKKKQLWAEMWFYIQVWISRSSFYYTVYSTHVGDSRRICSLGMQQLNPSARFLTRKATNQQTKLAMQQRDKQRAVVWKHGETWRLLTQSCFVYFHSELTPLVTKLQLVLDFNCPAKWVRFTFEFYASLQWLT